MSTARQRRRGTTAQHSTFTGLVGEITIDTDKKVVVVHDGVTAGGVPLAKATDASPVETQTHAATSKVTPVDADELPIVDSAASNGLKKLTWANLKTVVGAAVFTAWGGLINAATGKTTPVDADAIEIMDSAATNATKKLTMANLAVWIGAYLGPLVAAATGKTTPVDADSILVSDSAATNATKKVTLTNFKAFLKTYFDGLYATAGGSTYGGCQLVKNGSNLQLNRYGGTALFINGTAQTIPVAGVTLAPPSDTVTMTIATPAVVTLPFTAPAADTPIKFSTSGALPTGVVAGTLYYVKAPSGSTCNLAATPGGAAINTTGSQSGTHKVGILRYIYAWMNSGTMTLEAAVTVPAADATNGNQIKTGDATRSLVGMAFDSSTAWVDSATQRLVVSYFNRREIGLDNGLATSPSTSSASLVEISTALRCEFLTWADEAVLATCNVMHSNSGTRDVHSFAISFDGTVPENDGYVNLTSAANAGDGWLGTVGLLKSGLAVGYHYAALLVATNAGTMTILGASAASPRTSMSAKVRG